jgi:hypothetical protein
LPTILADFVGRAALGVGDRRAWPETQESAAAVTSASVPEDATESAVDELYGERPDTFVSRREELVKALRRGGDPDGAAAVHGLRRPSLVAWSVNQVARTDPGGVHALLAAADELRDAIGSGDGDRIRVAMRGRRAHVEALTEAALARATELSPGAATHRDAIAGTWEAATARDEDRDLVTRGRLTSELRPGAVVDDLLSGIPPSSVGPTRGAHLPRRRAAVLPRDELALRRAEDALTEARRELADAVATAEEADRELAHAERAATTARAARRRAEARVERAQQTVAQRRSR